MDFSTEIRKLRLYLPILVIKTGNPASLKAAMVPLLSFKTRGPGDIENWQTLNISDRSLAANTPRSEIRIFLKLEMKKSYKNILESAFFPTRTKTPSLLEETKY